MEGADETDEVAVRGKKASEAGELTVVGELALLLRGVSGGDGGRFSRKGDWGIAGSSAEQFDCCLWCAGVSNAEEFDCGRWT